MAKVRIIWQSRAGRLSFSWLRRVGERAISFGKCGDAGENSLGKSDDEDEISLGKCDFEEFKGSLTEQFVCQELITHHRLQTTYYWTSSATAEVNFLLSDGMEVFPLECKAGTNMNAKSLRLYKDRYAPA